MAFGTLKVDSITTGTKTVTVDDLVTLDQTTANFTGTLQKGGSDVVVDGDIDQPGGVQGFDADTAKTDAVQTFTAQQTFGELKEGVYTHTTTTGSIALDPANGSVQTLVLTGAPSFTDSLESGQTVVLHLEGADANSPTWFGGSITWVTAAGNAAPTVTAKDVFVFWKVSTTLYGAYVGSYV